MEARFDYAKAAPGALRAMLGLGEYLHSCGLEESLLELVYLRTSQINGCAWCMDVHMKDMRAFGEDNSNNKERLYSLDPWSECPYYTNRERAALQWTEAVTLIANGRVPEQVYEEVRPYFNEKELSDLTLAVVTMNSWNRLNISAGTFPGDYRPAKPYQVDKYA